MISVRKSADITQQELAQRLKKPQSFVSKYERGERRIDIIEFISIAKAINANPCAIIKQIENLLNTNK